MRSKRFVVATLALGVMSCLPLAAQEGPALVIERALQRVESGDLEGAISLLEATGSGAPPVDALLGALYLETGRAPEAYQRLAPLARSDAADPGVLYNAGRAAIELGQLEDARAFLSRSTELDASSPSVRDLGLLLATNGNCRGGYVYLHPWAMTHSDDLGAQFIAAACAVELERAPEAEHFLSGLPQERPEVQFLWGELLLLKGDPWGALAILKPLAEASPDAIDPDLRQMMAEGYLTVGQSSAAIEVLEGNVGTDPTLVMLLTDAYYQSGDLDRAIATIEPVASPLASADPAAGLEDPMIAALLIEYGRLLVLGGRHEDALPALSLGTRLSPGDPRGWQPLGQALSGVGRTEEANQALQRFQDLTAASERRSLDQAELDAADPTGREIRRGFILAHNGSANEALEIARQENALAPGDFRPLLLAAMSLLILDRPTEALQSAELALQLAPDNADAYYQRGVIQMNLGSPDLAESDLRQAITIAPDHLAAMNDLAILLLQKGSREEAQGLLERVVELQPNDPVAAENLARIRETSQD
jgi:Flp pilus assembly protein TadD